MALEVTHGAACQFGKMPEWLTGIYRELARMGWLNHDKSDMAKPDSAPWMS